MAQPLAVLAAVAVLLFIPALTGLLSFVENRRLGQTARQRALLGGSLAAGLARAFGNAVWTLWLTVLVLPLGRLMGAPSGTFSVVSQLERWNSKSAWVPGPSMATTASLSLVASLMRPAMKGITSAPME